MNFIKTIKICDTWPSLRYNILYHRYLKSHEKKKKMVWGHNICVEYRWEHFISISNVETFKYEDQRLIPQLKLFLQQDMALTGY